MAETGARKRRKMTDNTKNFFISKAQGGVTPLVAE
jgi:hypothetical protein